MRNFDYIFLDIDGTLTDGKVYYSENGDELKAFNIKDGLLLAAMGRIGYRTVVITGRKSSIVERRCKELGITDVFQGVSNKVECFKKFIKKENIDTDRCCYIGDDLNDLAIMKNVGVRACPSDACDEIKDLADYISEKKGGDGAVRNILEYYLKNDGEWDKLLKQYS